VCTFSQSGDCGGSFCAAAPARGFGTGFHVLCSCRRFELLSRCSRRKRQQLKTPRSIHRSTGLARGPAGLQVSNVKLLRLLSELGRRFWWHGFHSFESRIKRTNIVELNRAFLGLPCSQLKNAIDQVLVGAVALKQRLLFGHVH
jgi:hypothetical protein